MDISFINKHKMGFLALLFFILLVSQDKNLHFLIHTILGRLSLILLILGISNFSIILGVVAVIFVIIMVNKDNAYYLEAFDPEMDDSNNNLQKMKDKLQSNKSHQDMIATTSLSATNQETFKGREGFNTLDRERDMQKGKSSNQIPVTYNQNTDNVEPFNNSSINYSLPF